MPSSSRPLPIAVIGAGRVAQTFGRLLAERGEPVTTIAGRSPERARVAAAFIGFGVKPAALNAILVQPWRLFIAVSDRAVPEVASLLAARGLHEGVALHTCGARGPEALAPLAKAGFACGVLHPLQTIAGPEQGLSALPGCTLGIDGDAAALAWSGSIARLLEASTLRVSAEGRMLYHAAAVMASNYIISLMDAAAILMDEAGLSRDEAIRALAPLIEATVANGRRFGIAGGLTGPIQRGDIETVSGHLAALERAPRAVRSLYCAVGRYTAGISVRCGLTPDNAREIEELLAKCEAGDT
jgi:predicted short-subunit dehydrogenase-like oxidoreductase (DUF2520 family)